jgi:predicted PurR-regulated permease PerM
MLLVAIALSEFLSWLNRRVGVGPAIAGFVTIVSIFVVVSLPIVQDEYDLARSYMRNIAQTLNEVGQDGDIIVAISLSLPSEVNLVGTQLNYYLDTIPSPFTGE